jgi:hypothetical protein
MATTRLNLKPIGQVCGKHRFYHADEAEREINRLQWRDRTDGKTPSPMSVYFCTACDAFHITRKGR